MTFYGKGFGKGGYGYFGAGKGGDPFYSGYYYPASRGRSVGRKGGKGPSLDNYNNEKSSQNNYYFDIYPERAKGLKVIRCKNPICFGCTLLGDKPAKTCRLCGWNFDLGNTPKARSQSPATGSSTSKGELSKHHSKMVELGLESAQASDLINQMLGTKYTPPPTTPTRVSVAPDFSEATSRIKKANSEMSQIENEITQQDARYKKFYDGCLEAEEKLDALQCKKTALLEHIDSLNKQVASEVGESNVALHAAKQLGDTSLEHMQSLYDIMEHVPSEHSQPAMSCIANLLSVAQSVVSEAVSKEDAVRGELDALKAKMLGLEQSLGRNLDCKALLKSGTQPPTKPPDYVPTNQSASSKSGEERTSDGMTKPGAATAPDAWEMPKGKRRVRELRTPGEPKPVPTSNSHAALSSIDADDDDGSFPAIGSDGEI
jgi:hypothetical protein